MEMLPKRYMLRVLFFSDMTKVGVSVTIDEKVLKRTREIAELVPLSRYMQRLLELEIQRIDSEK